MSLSIKKIFLYLVLSISMLALNIGTVANAATTDSTVASYKALGAALAVGLAGIGGGYAVAQAGAAGLSALTEKPELFSNVLLVVALGEGIAIYGLIVAILVIILL